MMAILTAFVETAALIAVVSGIQLAVLAFRNPLRPHWLRVTGSDNFASMLIATSLAFAVGFEISGLVAAGLNPAMAMGLTVGLVFGVGIFNWRAFRCGERLRRADAGLSPFAALDKRSSPRRARATPVSE